MKYFLIAGEASGDLHAGRLISALRNTDNDALFRFLGGDCMQQASGVEPTIHYKRMAYMAFSEVLRHLPDILSNLKNAKADIDRFRPDALILVDYPSFNLKVAKYAWKKGIPVYYYISPKVWAWKAWRVKAIRKYVSKMFSILPFETEFYAARDFKVDYVGNPTVNEIEEARQHFPEKTAFMAENGIRPDLPLIALLPGSRIGEIRNNLPLMAEAAAGFADHHFVVAGAPNIDRDFYRKVLSEASINVDFEIVYDRTFALLHHSEAALVTSGTATLETAVIGTPQVVCYRANGSKLAYSLFERILNVKFVSLPNLIAGRKVVPELLLHLCNAGNMEKELKLLLRNPERRQKMLDGYREISRRLGQNDSAATAARMIVDHLNAGK